MSDDRKILLGMMRPTLSDIAADIKRRSRGQREEFDRTQVPIDRKHDAWSCPRCRAHFACYWRTIEAMAGSCWEKGHFDTPVYATADEIIDRVAEKIVERMDSA